MISAEFIQQKQAAHEDTQRDPEVKIGRDCDKTTAGICGSGYAVRHEAAFEIDGDPCRRE